MHRGLLLGASWLVLAAAGCGDDSSASSSTPDLVRSWVSEVNKQVSIWCECKRALGFTDAIKCENATGYVFASDQRCYLEAFEQDAAGSREFLECAVDANRTQRKCLYRKLHCDDFDTADACNAEFQDAVMKCGMPPARVGDALGDCPPIIVGPVQ